MPETAEKTTTTEEQDTAQKVSQALDELASVPGEEGETSAESTEAEEKSKEGAETETETEEEGLDQKVDRVAEQKAQQMTAKATLTLEKQRNEAWAKIAVLEGEVNNQAWEREVGRVFQEEKDNIGEDDAKLRLSDREKVGLELVNYRRDKPEMDAWKEEHGVVERNQQLREELWVLLVPDDKDKVAQVGKLLKKFEGTKDWDECKPIMELVKETIKSKRKAFVPDSSRGSGGGTQSLLTPEAKVTKGLEDLKKKQR